jgi:hypothetical protein
MAGAVVNRKWQKKKGDGLLGSNRHLSKKLHSQLGLVEDSLPAYKKERTLQKSACIAYTAEWEEIVGDWVHLKQNGPHWRAASLALGG